MDWTTRWNRHHSLTLLQAGLKRIDVEASYLKMWILAVVFNMIQTRMIVIVCFAFIVIQYKLTINRSTISNIFNLKLQMQVIIWPKDQVSVWCPYLMNAKATVEINSWSMVHVLCIYIYFFFLSEDFFQVLLSRLQRHGSKVSKEHKNSVVKTQSTTRLSECCWKLNTNEFIDRFASVCVFI